MSMNEWNEIISKQFYLYSRCGTVCVGFFPWRDMVIMVILDGGCTGWALHIEENSRVELLTKSAARDEWDQWVNERNYTTNDTGTGMLRTSCHGLAIRWRNQKEQADHVCEERTKNMETFTTMLNKIVKQLNAENPTTITEYTNYNYAMEA